MPSLTERLPGRLQPAYLWRAFHGELPQDNDAKGTAIILVWAASALVAWKTGGGVYDQLALGLLTLAEGYHQAFISAHSPTRNDQTQSPKRSLLQQLEDNLFESPRK